MLVTSSLEYSGSKAYLGQLRPDQFTPEVYQCRLCIDDFL